MKNQYYLFPLFLVIYEIITYLSNDMYLPALPQIAQVFKITEELSALSLTTWFLGSATMQLILGPVSDRFGRRSVLLWGGLFFVISTLFCAIAQNITTLLIARFIQGCAICSVVVPGYATIHELFDQKESVKTLSWMNSVTLLAPAFGPLCGSAILFFGSWRAIFWILALLAIFCLMILYHKMPETNPEVHPLRLRSLFSNYLMIIKNRKFMRNTLSFCFLFCGSIIWIVISPFLIITQLGETTNIYGLYQVCIFSSFIFGTQFVKYSINRVNITQLINLGLIVSLLGSFTSLIVSYLFFNKFIYQLLALMVYSLGGGIAFAPLSRAAIEASVQPMGSRMAIFSGMMGISGVFGSILGNTFYNGTFFSFAVMLVILTILSFRLMPRS